MHLARGSIYRWKYAQSAVISEFSLFSILLSFFTFSVILSFTQLHFSFVISLILSFAHSFANILLSASLSVLPTVLVAYLLLNSTLI